MKKIEAIIRKTKFEEVKAALLSSDIDWFEYHISWRPVFNRCHRARCHHHRLSRHHCRPNDKGDSEGSPYG